VSGVKVSKAWDIKPDRLGKVSPKFAFRPKSLPDADKSADWPPRTI
jgi:hypothetical protein